MADYLIQDTTLGAIANAINAKTGGSSALTPSQMVTEIGSIQTGGGSLPAPVTAIKTGSFTLAEDVASYELTHDLGVVPQLIFVWCEGFTGSLRSRNMGKSSMVVLSQVGNEDNADNWFYFARYSHITSGNMLNYPITYVKRDVTATIAKIHTNTSLPLGATLTTASGTSPATWRWLALSVSS